MEYADDIVMMAKSEQNNLNTYIFLHEKTERRE